MILQETCLNGQLNDGSLFEGMAPGGFALVGKDGADGDKNVVFIVYNFLEKCLNQSLAAAFRAPNRCGLLSSDFGRREV